jgi:tetratricopeptide (TPR) repeat protein
MKALRVPAAALAATLLGTACAHGPAAAPTLTEPARALARQAAGLGPIQFEEDFLEARFVYQALPLELPERRALRQRMLGYLLGPLEAIDVASVRRAAGDIGANDDLDRVFESLKDALELFAPRELWAAKGAAFSAEERRLLALGARRVMALHGPQGAEAPVALALYTLATLEPSSREWPERLDALLSWLDRGAQIAMSQGGPRNAASAVEVLEGVVGSWPAPAPVERLGRLYAERQEKMATLLRRPLGAPPPRAAIGELLLEGEAVQNTAVNIVTAYLRAGQIERAAQRAKDVAGRPGDDPELRQLLEAAARARPARNDLLALARRFLPRMELLGGTSNDRVDPVAAFRVLEVALAERPADPELLVLASRVARFLPAHALALRLLEEALPARERAGAKREELIDLATEILDLSFAKLRRLLHPDRIEPAVREAEELHRRFAETRRRFGIDRLKLRDEDIDLELARGLVEAGLVDRAEALFERATRGGDIDAEVALQMGNLALKRGDFARATKVLADALERHRAEAPTPKTIPHVEAEGKLARALGTAHEMAGQIEAARTAWKLALRSWETLMVEHMRRRNAHDAAEATMEVARLQYMLGNQSEGLQKFLEGLEQSESRYESYIDAVSFLVQQGDTDGALDIYRRALSKPSRTVPEEHKVYTSLWILDLTRRAGRGADASAEAFLRSIDARTVHLRPHRVSAWYRLLVRYAIGRLSYDELLPQADTAGKKAELYFYEAMKRLSEGRSDDAHLLWNKVIETKMFSFFEYEMASRYLRTGAPTHARPLGAPETI